MSVSYGRERQLLEYMSASLGDGRTFFVTPDGYSRSGAFMQSIAGKGPGMVFTTVSGALAACTAGRGDRVFLLPGTHIISSEVLVDKSDLSLEGAGSNRTFIASAASGTGNDFLRVTANGCTIKGICFQPKMTLNNIAANYKFDDCTNFAISLIGATGTTIKGCKFTDGGSQDSEAKAGRTTGVNIGYSSHNTVIEDCDFINMFHDGVNFHSETGVSPASIISAIIRRCLFQASHSGISTGDGLTDTDSAGSIIGIVVTDCTFFDAGASTINLDHSAVTYMMCLFANNSIAVAAYSSAELKLGDSQFGQAGNFTTAGVSGAAL